MTSPILALRRAILDACSGDSTLSNLMGGTLRLHDEPPRAAAPVYAVFGDVSAVDWSADEQRGHEQDFEIAVWAKEGSARDAIAAAERFAAILDGANLPLTGHRMINLTITTIAATRDKDSRLMRVSLRLRAVTEVM